MHSYFSHTHTFSRSLSLSLARYSFRPAAAADHHAALRASVTGLLRGPTGQSAGAYYVFLDVCPILYAIIHQFSQEAASPKLKQKHTDTNTDNTVREG